MYPLPPYVVLLVVSSQSPLLSYLQDPPLLWYDNYASWGNRKLHKYTGVNATQFLLINSSRVLAGAQSSLLVSGIDATS